ncbi:MAG: hypothetical protein HY744_09470 [Deltaproteobacteria bacterium]|nr:hypothetical protein [Deltaproteobacteria bacterium]
MKSRARTTMLCAALALLPATAAADAGGGAGAARPQSPAPARAEGAHDPQDKLAIARTLVLALWLKSDRLYSDLRSARRVRDTQRSACLDDLVTQAHAMERLGQEAFRAAALAAERERAAEIAPQIERLRMYDEHSRQLVEQSRDCAPRAAAGG